MYKFIKLLLLCIIISLYTSAYAATETVTHIVDTGLSAREQAVWERLRVSEGTRERSLKEPKDVGKLPKRSVGKLNPNRLSLWEPREDPSQKAPLVVQKVEKAIQKAREAEADIQVTQTALKRPDMPVEQGRQLEDKVRVAKAAARKSTCI